MKVEIFIAKSISGELSLEDQKQFLLKLNKEGFTGSDIANMVKVFYNQMPKTLVLPNAIDLCGTGGSGLSRINTSTISSVVLAACGVPVAKHGNKAASGRFGSFDLLESIGINIMADKERLEDLYQELGLAFIFARHYHPVFKHFGQVRQELKVKTIFNILGPLLNPANPQYQIIGTSNPQDMQLMADAAKALGKNHVLVLNGSDGLDELTLTGETAVLELRDGNIENYVLSPEDFGFQTHQFREIEGGDRDFNVAITESILKGSCETAHLDLVLANTALALKFMGEVETYIEGVEKARAAIQDGSTKQLLERYAQLSNLPDILKQITDHKFQEIIKQKRDLPLEEIKKELKLSERDFKGAISKTGNLNLIAEIKKSSPSEQEIYKGDFNPSEIASLYEKGGADAISVLTDRKYFGGSLENLQLAQSATRTTPLLLKDFIIDEYQIYLARYFGADAILLIQAILSQEQVDEYYRIASSLGMDVLLEIHNELELDMALRSSADIIGVNNRNLHNFKIDTRTFLKLFHQIPKDKTIVAESGYSAGDISSIQGFANAALVGSSIMRSGNILEELRALKTVKKKFKACGIRTVGAARHCEETGIDFVGINFVLTSKRSVDSKLARNICAILQRSNRVGIFQNQALEEVIAIAKEVGLDFVQLSGSESVEYCREIPFPVIKTIGMDQLDLVQDYIASVEMFIIDGAQPGSGEGYDYSRLQNLDISTPYLVAGGVNKTNVEDILTTLPLAAGIDTASGIESDGTVDIERINAIKGKVTRF